MNTTSLLSVLARNAAMSPPKETQQPRYIARIDSKELIRKAILERGVSLFVLVLLCFSALFYLIRYTIASRLMGLEISDNFRARIAKQNSVSDLPKLLTLLSEEATASVYVMIVRPKRENIERLMNENKEK